MPFNADLQVQIQSLLCDTGLSEKDASCTYQILDFRLSVAYRDRLGQKQQKLILKHGSSAQPTWSGGSILITINASLDTPTHRIKPRETYTSITTKGSPPRERPIFLLHAQLNFPKAQLKATQPSLVNQPLLQWGQTLQGQTQAQAENESSFNKRAFPFEETCFGRASSTSRPTFYISKDDRQQTS